MIYESNEDADTAAAMDTVAAALGGGLTEQVTDEGHVLCKNPDTMELVDVSPDGSWEYQNAKDDGTMEEMVGSNAALLAMFLYSDENKKMFYASLNDEDGVSGE